MKVFLDSSVLFSSMYSATGASAELLRLASNPRNRLHILVSYFVLLEVRRNLEDKYPAGVVDFDAFVDLLTPEHISNPDKALVQTVAQYTELKDAPIVAAAKHAQVDYLVTLDRQHLIDPKQVSRKSGVRIVEPHDVLTQVRQAA